MQAPICQCCNFFCIHKFPPNLTLMIAMTCFHNALLLSNRLNNDLPFSFLLRFRVLCFDRRVIQNTTGDLEVIYTFSPQYPPLVFRPTSRVTFGVEVIIYNVVVFHSYQISYQITNSRGGHVVLGRTGHVSLGLNVRGDLWSSDNVKVHLKMANWLNYNKLYNDCSAMASSFSTVMAAKLGTVGEYVYIWNKLL